jgi:hypothetical protein
MRLYGKRWLRNAVNYRIGQASETQDAVLMTVLPAQRLAQVQVQGSTNQVTAFYPENWEQTPVWLKPGNVVRITHRGGVRGYIELTGHGQLAPTVGGTPVAPVIPQSVNAVLSGLQVMALPAPNPSP